MAVDDSLLTTVFTPSINPRTGQSYIVKHVSNNGPVDGNGSFERPWDRLDLANGSDADMILVYSSGTTPFNPLPAGDGLQLQNYQRLLGEGVPHFFTDDMRGTFLLPFISPVGPSPFVAGNPGATIVSLAGNNEVNGLNILSPANGVAIGGNGAYNFDILNINKDVNLPENTGAGSGIVLHNAHGTGFIQNVAFNIPNLTAMGGIRITNVNTDPLTLGIDGVRFLDGGQAGLSLYGNNSIINATAANVRASSNRNGLLMDALNNGRVDLAIAGSTFNDAVNGLGSGRGMTVRGSSGGRLNLIANNTSAGGADIDGLLVHLSGGADANVSLTNGNLSAAGRDAVHLDVNNATLDLSLASTQANGVGRDAFHVEAANLADINVMLTNSNFDNATQDAFDLSLTSNARVDLVAQMTTGTSAIQNSLLFNVDQNSLLNLGFSQSNLSGAALGDGIHGTLANGADAMLVFTGTNVTNVGGDALDILADTGALFDGSFSNGSFSDAGGSAVLIDVNNGSGAQLAMSNMTANQAGAYGLSIFGDNNSLFNVNLSSTTFHDAGMTAVQAIANNGSMGVVTGNAVSGMNSGGDGIDLQASAGQLTANFTNTGSFVIAAGNGINVAANMGGVVNASIAGTLANPANFSNAGMDGLNVDLNDGTANVTLNNVNLANAAKHGMDINSLNGSTFIGMTTNVDISGAGMNAINLNSDPGSTIILNGDNLSGANSSMNALNIVADASVVDVNITNADFFANAGINSIFINALNGGTANVDIAGTMGSPADFTGAAGDAVQALLTGGSTINLALADIDFSGAAGNGLLVDATDSFFNGTVTRGDFSDAGLNAVAVLSDNSLVSLGLTSTAMDDAGMDGLHVEENQSTVDISIVNGSIERAGDDAFDIVFNRSVNLFVDPTSAANATNNGLEFVGNMGGTLTTTLVDTSLANAGMNGILGVLDNGSTAILNLTNSSADGAAMNGASIVANNGSTFNGTFTGSSFNNAAAGNGFGLTLQNGSVGNVILDNSSANGAGLDGFNRQCSQRIAARGPPEQRHHVQRCRQRRHPDHRRHECHGDRHQQHRHCRPMAGDNGIDVDATNNSTVNMTLVNAGSFNNATNAGVDVSNDNSTVNLGISGGSFNTAGGDGLLFTLTNGANSNLTLSGTSATGADDGLDVTATGGSTMNGTVSGTNFSGAVNNGIELDFNGSMGQFAFTNTNFSNAGLRRS